MSVLENAPCAQSRFCDDEPSRFGLGDKVLKYERIAPGKRLFRVAYRVVLVAVRIIHQQRADLVGPQLRREATLLLPSAIIVTADLWARFIDAAAAGQRAVLAKLARRLFEFVDFKNLAAEEAGAAGLARNVEHVGRAPMA